MDNRFSSAESFDLDSYFQEGRSQKSDDREEELIAILCEGLNSVRKYLDMDIAFLSEFLGGKRVFRFLDSANSPTVIQVDNSDPLEETYCQRIIEGRFPQLIPDVSDFEPARRLRVTTDLNIKSYAGVPVILSDGSTYGTFCCYSSESAKPLDDKHLAIVRAFSSLAANMLETLGKRRKRLKDLNEKIRSIIDTGAFYSVYQPIHDIKESRVVGYEALTRFLSEPIRPPNMWFDASAKVEFQTQLEIEAIKRALKALEQLPNNTYLSLNVSPQTIFEPELKKCLEEIALDRIVLEITEHDMIEDYGRFNEAMSGLRAKGLRLAIDDVGAGYSSLRHILEVDPDIIKLDRSLIQDIDSRPNRHALASSLVTFSSKLGISVVAEGIETDRELKSLNELNIGKAQGYLLGRPAPLSELDRE